jgi:predicted TPR repeat methyltransferase
MWSINHNHSNHNPKPINNHNNKGDSKSKALYDAEKCVKIAPMWSKGYARLGAAQQSLKRFDPAIDTFKKG